MPASATLNPGEPQLFAEGLALPPGALKLPGTRLSVPKAVLHLCLAVVGPDKPEALTDELLPFSEILLPETA